jgi:hypothetical protein
MGFASHPLPLRGGGRGRGEPRRLLSYREHREAHIFEGCASPHPQPPPLKRRGLVEH